MFSANSTSTTGGSPLQKYFVKGGHGELLSWSGKENVTVPKHASAEAEASGCSRWLHQEHPFQKKNVM